MHWLLSAVLSLVDGSSKNEAARPDEEPDDNPCLSEDDVREYVARLGRSAPWLTILRPVRTCLDGIVGPTRVCMGKEITRALALCVYGHEASGL